MCVITQPTQTWVHTVHVLVLVQAQFNYSYCTCTLHVLYSMRTFVLAPLSGGLSPRVHYMLFS
jgi:hypothetical protein